MATAQNFTQHISTLYRQMPPDIQLSWIKSSIEQSKNISFEIQCRIARIEIGYSSRNFKFTIPVTILTSGPLLCLIFLCLYYPGPRGFSWFFSARESCERAAKRWKHESGSGEKEKPNTPIPEKTGSCTQARLNSPRAFKMADEMLGKNEKIRMYVG